MGWTQVVHHTESYALKILWTALWPSGPEEWPKQSALSILHVWYSWSCAQGITKVCFVSAVHPMQDFIFTHWFSFNVPTWATILISRTCKRDQLQWPFNCPRPLKGPAGGLNLLQLADILADHLTDYSPFSISIIILCIAQYYNTYACVCMCLPPPLLCGTISAFPVVKHQRPTNQVQNVEVSSVYC